MDWTALGRVALVRVGVMGAKDTLLRQKVERLSQTLAPAARHTVCATALVYSSILQPYPRRIASVRAGLRGGAERRKGGGVRPHLQGV